ncbi:flagellar basal body P-ring formation protein FlgA [Amphritea sp. ZJ14W]|uniref:Flagella basal body P-ring formation protein FlgA n=1 Tax=Amphritea pacifica TaxID=2811233 RepID=A0ABS2W502_9GAMM|nr:flagellar basal body P-ring formation protein FlgA [Amphritea pacifica]MBN1005234.1 flagellar basal body P-ring formation protein FlgA [Amphritea pacifica]
MKKNIFSTIITLIAMLAVPVKSTLAAETDSISQKAQQFLEQQYQKTAPMARTVVRVSPLAPTLDKRRCNGPISFIHAPGRATRITAKAICNQPVWTIFISATIEQWQPVVVSSRALSKGTILGDSDIYLKEYDTKSLSSAYFTNPGELIGREVKRSLASNQIISPTLVEKRLLIRKGDLVYIEARKGAMTVRMTGTAEQDGSLGEQISVINSRSGKQVYGYVKSQGVVSVNGQ